MKSPVLLPSKHYFTNLLILDQHKNDYLIQCERCETWHCHACAKVSEQLIGLLVDCNEAHWFCHTCNPIAVEAICNLNEINPSGAVS